MYRLSVSRWLLPALLVVAVPGMSSGAGPASSRKAQLEFGVDMAKRGLWSEALFRFENARKLDPGDLAVLNNLAVCFEAAGRFEDALATYREALKLDPANRVLKQNYSRFAEFYQGYRPRTPGTTQQPQVLPTLPAEETPAAEPAPSPAPPPSPPRLLRGGGR